MTMSQAPRRQRPSLGEILDGRWRITGLLGYGGHAGVYRAQHVQLRYPVAIKALSGPLQSAITGELHQRLLIEAEIGALVRHPNVLQIFDVGHTSEGEPFLVMEIVDGETLRERLNKCVLSIAQVIDLALQVLDGLAALARHGIVHRDIKPSNLMLKPEARGVQVKLIDLGVARRVSQISTTADSSEEFLVGTPNYMAPEQLRAQHVDVRADVFSLGVVLYEALTGTVPPRPTFVERYALDPELSIDELPSVRQHRPDCPRWLDVIIQKATAIDRDARYCRPEAMAEALAIIARDLDLPTGARAWLGGDSPCSIAQSPPKALLREAHATRRERVHPKKTPWPS